MSKPAALARDMRWRHHLHGSERAKREERFILPLTPAEPFDIITPFCHAF